MGAEANIDHVSRALFACVVLVNPVDGVHILSTWAGRGAGECPWERKIAVP